MYQWKRRELGNEPKTRGRASHLGLFRVSLLGKQQLASALDLKSGLEAYENRSSTQAHIQVLLRSRLAVLMLIFDLRRQQDEEEELRRECRKHEGLFVARYVASRYFRCTADPLAVLHSCGTVITIAE